MSDDLIFRSDEASKGTFRSIRKVRGRLASITRVASRFEESKFGQGPPKDQVEVILEDAEILVMAENEPMPELKEGKFTTWIPYAQPGRKPHDSSFYVRGFLKSGEAVGVMPDYQDKWVTLEQQEVALGFKRKNSETDELEDVVQEGFVFVEDDDAAFDINTYIKGLVVGKNPAAAQRAVLLDVRAKRYPDMVAAVRDGSIAKILNLGQDPTTGVYLDSAPETEQKAEE